MQFAAFQKVLYKTLREDTWHEGTYLRQAFRNNPDIHVLENRNGLHIHRQTENIKPSEMITNKEAKSLLEVDYS